MSTGSVFVTVGSTSFDELIETILTAEIQKILGELLGFKRIVLQTGRGKDFKDFIQKSNQTFPLLLDIYSFKPTIKPDMEMAELIISHAGAGSILESLRLGKRVIVVVNEQLMDNHQIEIARKLHKEGYLLYATCKTLASALQELQTSSFKPFPAPHPAIFQSVLEEEMGISS